MAIRTGTQLLSDMAAAESALATAAPGSSRANIQAAIAALTVVVQNAYDSRYSIEVSPSDVDRGGLHRPAKAISALAADFRSELRAADIDAPTVVRAPITGRVFQRLTTSAWTRYRDLGFTT